MRKHIILILATVFVSGIMNAANIQTKLYICGFVTSFTDSTVYFTDIQVLDSAWVNAKTGFLYSRNNYSYQLRDYMKKNKGMDNPTCITIYAQKRKDIEKKYAALMKKYTSSGIYNIQYISAENFAYMLITPDPFEIKEDSSKDKKNKEEQKRQRPDMGNRPSGAPGGGGRPGGRM